MYGVCFRYVCHREIAQDLLHDGFITVFSKIGDFRGEGSLEGWIRRIFVNTALGYLRKKNVLQGSEQIDALRQVEGTEASAVERMETAELLRCIGKLPDGYSHREIAEMLGVSEGTSRSQYLRAKGCLLKILKEEEVI